MVRQLTSGPGRLTGRVLPSLAVAVAVACGWAPAARAAWAPPIQLSPRGYGPVGLLGGDGGARVLWDTTSGRPGFADALPSGAIAPRSPLVPAPSGGPALAELSGGRMLVGLSLVSGGLVDSHGSEHMAEGSIELAVVDPTGRVVRTATPLGISPSAAAIPGHGAVVTWLRQSGSRDRIFEALVDPTGKLGRVHVLAGGPASKAITPELGPEGQLTAGWAGGAVTAWPSAKGLVVRRIATDGTPGRAIVVTPPRTHFAFSEQPARLSVNAFGAIAVAWGATKTSSPESPARPMMRWIHADNSLGRPVTVGPFGGAFGEATETVSALDDGSAIVLLAHDAEVSAVPIAANGTAGAPRSLWSGAATDSVSTDNFSVAANGSTVLFAAQTITRSTPSAFTPAIIAGSLTSGAQGATEVVASGGAADATYLDDPSAMINASGAEAVAYDVDPGHSGGIRVSFQH